MKAKNKLDIRITEIKNRGEKFVLNFKMRHMKEEKDIAPIGFSNILQNQVFQRTAKFIEIKGIVLLVKVDEMYNI